MIDPVGMSLRDWADSVIFATSDAWSLPRLDDEARWQEWGVAVLRAYQNQNPPNPYQFADWRDWARRVYPMLEVTS